MLKMKMKKYIPLGILVIFTAYVVFCTRKIPEAAFKTTPELAEHYGFDFETRIVKTKLDEKIVLFRLPQPGKPAVLIHHGIISSSAMFLSLGEKSLAYRLYKLGLDVWLINSRETYYSRPSGTEKDWNFTWEDMATQDLPEIIDYVIEKTSEAKVNYIGHSQGALLMYTLLADKPDYNEKINLFCALAPAVFIHTEYTMIFSLIPTWIFDTFTGGRVMVPKMNAHMCAMSEMLCKFLL